MMRQVPITLIAVALGAGIGDVGFASGHGSSHGAAHGSTSEIVEANNPFLADAKVRGVELGEFRIRAYYPVEAQKSTVRFVLHAAVASEGFAEAMRVVEARRNKLRDTVIMVTRMTPLDAFDEAGLTTFRRRILVRLRRALPELPIDEVFVSDFQLTVKSL